ncbi:MAG TPA: extracellular solute-binding protein [Limnochordia bacterium]|nr:extracellular solute-binding protein [Limnochordia bacterium]
MRRQAKGATRLGYRSAVATLMGLGLVSAVVWGDPRVLTFATHWSTGDDQYKLLSRYVAEYNAQQSQVKIELVQSSGFADSVNPQFLVQAAAGSAPDIIHTPASSLAQYGDQLHFVQPAPPTVAADLRKAFLPGALTLATVKGILYGPPTENQIHAMALNGAVFEQDGLEVKAPSTWTELAALAHKIQRVSADGKLQVAGVEIIPRRSTLSMAWSNGGEVVNTAGDAVTTDTSAWTEMVLFLSGLVRDGSAVVNGSLFNEEKAGIRLGTAPWMRGGYLSASGEASYDKLVTAALPPGSTGRPVAEQYGYVIAVTSSAKDPAAAWNFVEWLAAQRTPEGKTRMGSVMASLGSIPTNLDDLRNQPTQQDPYLKGFIDILSKGETRTANDLPPLGIGIDNELEDQLTTAIQGELEVNNALEKMTKDLQSRLDDYLNKQK